LRFQKSILLLRFEIADFLRFQIAIFKNAVSKRFIFCDLVLNRTYCLRNHNLKRTLRGDKTFFYDYNKA
jgi:hypothetical protein